MLLAMFVGIDQVENITELFVVTAVRAFLNEVSGGGLFLLALVRF